VSEIKVGPQPLELISTHNGSQCVLVYTTVRRSNLVLFLEHMKEGAGRLSSVLCSGFSYISVSIQSASNLEVDPKPYSNLKEACLLVSI